MNFRPSEIFLGHTVVAKVKIYEGMEILQEKNSQKLFMIFIIFLVKCYERIESYKIYLYGFCQ